MIRLIFNDMSMTWSNKAMLYFCRQCSLHTAAIDIAHAGQFSKSVFILSDTTAPLFWLSSFIRNLL